MAAAIKVKYPSVFFRIVHFAQGDGAGKLRLVEEQLAARRPLLISLTVAPFGGWHIIPIFDADEQFLTLLELEVVLPNGVAQTFELDKERFVWIHGNWPGGNDVDYLESS